MKIKDIYKLAKYQSFTFADFVRRSNVTDIFYFRMSNDLINEFEVNSIDFSSLSNIEVREYPEKFNKDSFEFVYLFSVFYKNQPVLVYSEASDGEDTWDEVRTITNLNLFLEMMQEIREYLPPTIPYDVGTDDLEIAYDV